MTSSTRLGRAWKRSHRFCDQQIPSFVRTHAQLLYTVYNKDINNELPRRQIKRGQETRIIFLPTSSSSLRRRKGGSTDCIDRKNSTSDTTRVRSWQILSKSNWWKTGGFENMVYTHILERNEGNDTCTLANTWPRVLTRLVAREQYLDSRSGRDVSTEARKWTGPNLWQNYTKLASRTPWWGGPWTTFALEDGSLSLPLFT